MPGIGGVFLTSHDPARLIQWFADALDIQMEAQGDGAMAVMPAGDHVAILAVHPAKADTPAPPPGAVVAEPYSRQTMMVNLRVDDLDATIARLQENGDDVAGPATYDPIGRFAWTRTPDGHDVELWQA